jgi:hypothetical protein
MEGGVLTREKLETARKLKDYTLEEAVEDLEKLKSKVPPSKEDLGGLAGNKYLDYYFFPTRLDTISKKGVSFYDFLKTELNKKWIKSFVKNNRKLYPKQSVLDHLYNAFRLYYGSISSFKPIIASYIYGKYEPKVVLDFSAGWGGRLLGAMMYPNMKYIGFDTNKELKKPYAEMIKQLGVKDRARIIFQDSAKVDYSKYTYDMVFTSPPYFTIEKYEGMPSYDSYDGWVADFLEPVVRKSYAGLSRNGYFILNIPDKIYQSVKKILGGADTHFPLVIQQRHLNTKNHQLSSKGEYSEQVYVWRK